MLSDFALDLRLARRKSGLSQREVAHLLAISQPALSKLESGQNSPTVRQVTQFSLIYGRSFPALFEEIADELKPKLIKRLDALPERPRRHIAQFVRTRTLRLMRLRLTTNRYGGA